MGSKPTSKNSFYDPLKHHPRRSRLPSSSSRSNKDDHHIQSKISSGWTALSNDPFSQIDVNTSTFTLGTENSTISRKSIYPAAPLEDNLFSYTQPQSSPSSSSSSTAHLQKQLNLYPFKSYRLIKEAFQKAQLKNDPEHWFQFYGAMEKYATESHDPVAIVYLAMCLISGLGCDTQVQRGFDLLKKHPSCETSYVLGHCCLDGLPIQAPHTIQEVDKFMAFDYFKRAAHDYEPTNESIATTIAEAQCRLARMLFQGEGVQQNSKEAFDYLMKSAENNNRYAQFLVGVHYECGSDIPQDLEKAKWYYEKSAHQGFPDAQAALGNRLVVEERYEEGIGWLEKAVEMGNSRAHVQLGMMYDKGIGGIEQDDATALFHYKTAAKNNNRAAQYLLGLVYYFGRLGLSRNPREAIQWIRQAAVAGYPYAQRVLGQFYQQEGRNEREAIRWYKRAAINKDMIALDLLGRCYQHGIGVEIDLHKALAYYAKAAEVKDSPHVYYAKMDQALLLQHLGRHLDAFKIHTDIVHDADPVRDKEPIEIAKLSLGRYHLRNDIQGIPHNPALSFQLWTELVETTQHPDAFYWLGSCYDEGIPNVCDIDRSKAFLLFMTAAELGDVDSMFTVAGMMSNYAVPHKGPADAFPWYQKAAEKGHARAMYALGLCFHKGIGMDQPDLDTALEWLERAAKQGVVEAMSQIAKIYLQLRNREGHFIKAIQWLKRAADQEDVYAQRELGKIYLSEEGTMTNHTMAFQLLTRASLKNDAEAMSFLGHCYRKGTGVDKDLDMAAEYYLKSASLGYAFAYSAAAELYYEMGHFELAYDYYLLASKVPGITHTKTGMTARLMVARLTLGYIPTNNQRALVLLKKSIESSETKATSTAEAFEILFNLAFQDQFTLAFEPLGYCYLNGLGTEANLTQSLFWIRKAAEETKESTAYFRLYEIFSQRSEIPLALSYLRQSADLGHTEAQYRLGIIYLRGDFGFLRDERAATDFLKLSASKLHPESIWTLSQMAASIGQDELRLEYQKSAAALGHVLAMRELGQHYLKQLTAPFVSALVQQTSLDEALRYLHMAADLDDAESLILLGKTYANCTKTHLKFSNLQNTLPTPTDTHSFSDEEEIDPRWQSEEDEKALAIQCFERASALGNLEATVYAAEAWHEQKQYAAALDYFQKAAAQGHVLARFFCARYCIEGFGGIPVDHEKGFKELLICASELNCVHAYNTLGQCYENGVGVIKNNQLAYEWYHRAAKMTHDAEAYYRIAQMYAQECVALPERAMNKDLEALKVYQLATNASPKGHGPSCYQLGLYYLQGILEDRSESPRFVLHPDIRLAIEYLRQASDLNIKEAMAELGVLLLTQDFSLEEQEEGTRRLGLAAELGSPKAQFHLGLFCHRGKEEGEEILIPQDFEKAYDLFCRSAAQSHPGATYYLALYHHHGIFVAPDPDIALEQYTIAVDLFKHSESSEEERWQAEYNLGRLLHPKDRDRAYAFFQAAHAHAPEKFKFLSEIMLARYHLHGWAGVQAQVEEAAAVLIRFAEQEEFGYRVFLDVAQCFERGLGVAQDMQEAFYWYGQVIGKSLNDSVTETGFMDEEDEEDEAEAMFKLAEFYQKGIVVTVDTEKAESLYRLAAKKGSRNAQEYVLNNLKTMSI
ncbi:hypothetical protein RO3G_05855 [Rhizopus delemar RA 99-880]|uniref:HCP-like protein n=1 Tax=Rhizopus delemar (strain RA 99-880 / ATCC MYA-4621 / FGSC 9543 / NRRL 43880) TaxID=246409 RepID=I1BY70_RHIO9|nr:hypothetical protein RO3G_05855 [Rhizopus delemar RA 99-880]|eukprot:EIE81150.1 hypothetical protein RO3G_05855 [Rhizopus delemar RA 99-880]